MSEKRILRGNAVKFYGQIAAALNLPERVHDLTLRILARTITIYVQPTKGRAAVQRNLQFDEAFVAQLLKAIGLESKAAMEIMIRIPANGVAIVETRCVGEMSIEEDVDWSLLKLLPPDED